MATINGDDGDNFLFGTNLADTVNGLGGNDRVYGGDGNDAVYGGDGDDSLYGYDATVYTGGPVQSDALYGGVGNDSLYDLASGGGSGDSIIDGGDGIDLVWLVRRPSASFVTINITNPAAAQQFGDTTLVNVERIHFESLSNYAGANVTGGLYSDYLSGTAKSDTFNGAGGDDTIVGGGGGADRLYGGDGNDYVSLDYGAVVADGGTGFDSVRFDLTAATSGATVSLASTTIQNVAGTTFANFERFALLNGTQYADSVTGGQYDDVISGNGGDDLLIGGAGNDRVYGGGGADTLRGGDGDDVLAPDDQLTNFPQDGTVVPGFGGVNTLYGDAGNDTLHASGGELLVDGGTGTDLLIYSLGDLATGVTFSLADPAVDVMVNNTVVRGVEQLQLSGTQGDDHVTGTMLADRMSGLGGNDWLDGGSGDDTLIGSTGDDELHGGAGNDVLHAAEQPFLFYDNSDPNDNGNDRLFGEDGADQIFGYIGNDMLFGGAGADTIAGGYGNDIVVGGAGKDSLSGTSGNSRVKAHDLDVFVFNPGDSRSGGGVRDIITDFERGYDKVDLSALGVTSFSQVTLKATNGSMIVYVDLNHDGTIGSTDFGVQLSAVATVTAGDFIFA